MSYLQDPPIIGALKKYIDDWTVRFHMPGHKGRQDSGNLLGDFLGDRVFAADVTNVPGMDDLHQTHGVIKKAQEMAAATFGADSTYFLVNGSSCGLQALVMAACRPGEKILVPRNMHRSILSGIILSGAVPVFFVPGCDLKYKIPLGATPEAIQRCLDLQPDVKAVLLVSPTYHGITPDIPSIAAIAHSRGIPLLVDEAHGPHLCFHEDLPPSALEGGADATVQGVHKMLSAFTQASMLHLKGDRVDRQRLEASLKILQSTSTSYLLLASLDAARAQMAARGNFLVKSALELAGYLREKIGGIEGVSVFGRESVGSPGVFGLDLTKITISVRGLNVNGLWAEQWLREKHSIQVEMSDIFNLLLIVTFGNCRSDADRFLGALEELAGYAARSGIKNNPLASAVQIEPPPGVPELAVTPREAFWTPNVSLPLREAVGRICTEVIACYPPGIPVICPGERLTGEIIDYLEAVREMGVHFQGCHDPGVETVRVIK